MGKLIRDKIPELIRASGRVPRVSALSPAAYVTALQAKLHEEAAELVAASSTEDVVEEAADIIEVIAAIVAEHGATLDNVIDVARAKRARRGGFDKRLWLHGVESEPTHLLPRIRRPTPDAASLASPTT